MFNIFKALLLHDGPIKNFGLSCPGLKSCYGNEIDEIVVYLSHRDLQEFMLSCAAGDSDFPSRLPTPLHRLEILHTRNLDFSILKAAQFFVCLIISSPNLRELTIKLHRSQSYQPADSAATTSIGGLLEAEYRQGSGNRFLQQLRVFEMEECLGTQVELDLVKFVLATGPVLERIHIPPSHKLTSEKGVCGFNLSAIAEDNPSWKRRLLQQAADSFDYGKILQRCIVRGARKHGLLAHSHMITSGFASNPHSNSKLISFYAKVGDARAGRKVFDSMTVRNVVCWTAQISGYGQNECYEDALLLFSEMHRVGVKANQFTYGSVLRASSRLQCFKRGLQIQSCVQKSRFFSNLFVQSALIDLHSKCGSMEDACYLFETMLDRDVVSWNAMIGGYAVQGLGDDSFRLFHAMMTEGLLPDCFTLGSLLKVSGRTSDFLKVSKLHGFVEKLGFEGNLDLLRSIIDAYARCGGLESANCLYNTMEVKDIASCTALMNGLARNNYRTDAMNLFNEMRRMQHMKIDDVMLCSVLNMCANAASLTIGRQLHAFAVKNKPSYDVAVGNSLIDMYAKSGEIEDADRAFGEMREKNVISWTSLISGYGKHGYGSKAISLCKEMEDEGLVPNDITFLSGLFACSHSGLNKEALEFFNSMINRHNILPRAEHYSCVVDLFARVGQLEEAYGIICRNNITPNSSLWGAILGGCFSYGNVVLAETVAMHLINLNPDISVNYTVLGNIYATAGLWHKNCKIRNLMSQRNLKKTPGYSSVDSPRSIYLT
ncbi:unnamed protein product [Linum tenue]|uniref:Pentatricopeptide repeat-containing protein n=1 Tax=Linum tenue TaxID=586396 RepID=A0AAV0NII4_9ROSI|nr:unnamed protein product [Linum tenue]